MQYVNQPGSGNMVQGAHDAPYSKQQFEQFKQRVAHTLITEGGVDTVRSREHQQSREIITNFTKNEIMDKDFEWKLKGYTHKFTHVTVNTPRGIIEFPVVERMKGHFISSLLAFAIQDDEVKVIELFVNPNGIIL